MAIFVVEGRPTAFLLGAGPLVNPGRGAEDERVSSRGPVLVKDHQVVEGRQLVKSF